MSYRGKNKVGKQDSKSQGWGRVADVVCIGLPVKASMRRWYFNRNLKEMRLSGHRMYQVEATDCKFGGLKAGVYVATPGTDHGGWKVTVNT